jgi:hypothetical protein
MCPAERVENTVPPSPRSSWAWVRSVRPAGTLHGWPTVRYFLRGA